MSRLFVVITCIVLLFSATTQSPAQTDSTFRRLSLGPYFLPGASVFVGDVPYTWKTDLKFAWSAGVMSSFATNPRFALNLGLAYDNRQIYFYQENDKAVTNKITLSTFDVYTGAKFSDFMIGFAFGFPMNGQMELTDGLSKTVTASESHFSADSMGLKIDLRIGAVFNIVESETGKFQFMLQAAYPLTQIWDHTPYAMRKLNPDGTIEVQRDPVSGTTNTRSFENGVAASLQLGFAYLFNLGGKY